MDSQEFYQLAFIRNLGLVSEAEQQVLKNARVTVSSVAVLFGAGN